MSDLVPCPFCGETHGYEVNYYDGPLYGVSGPRCPMWVTAMEEEDCRSIERLRALYNKRPIEDALRSQIGILKSILKAVYMKADFEMGDLHDEYAAEKMEEIVSMLEPFLDNK